MSTTNDAVREVLARLELQATIIAECKLLEALAGLPEDDEDDWPAWTDEECWELGPEQPAPVWSAWLARIPLND